MMVPLALSVVFLITARLIHNCIVFKEDVNMSSLSHVLIIILPFQLERLKVIARKAQRYLLFSSIDQVTVTVPAENFTAVLGRRNRGLFVIRRGGTVSVNGVQYPNNGDEIIWETDNQRIQVKRRGGSPYVFLNGLGVQIFWSGLYRVRITVSSHLHDQICGLCGTYNDNIADDYTALDGTVSNRRTFANSWLVPSNVQAVLEAIQEKERS